MPPTNFKTTTATKAFTDSRNIPAATVPENRPKRNQLLFITDDVGIDMVDIYQADSFLPGTYAGFPLTPTLTSLATNGVRFRRMAVQPTCSPTRAMIECGRYGFRTGIGRTVASPGVGGITEFGYGTTAADPLEVSLARLVSARGYDTCVVGKWHLSLPNDIQDPGNVHESVHGLGYDHPEAIGYRVSRIMHWNLDRQPYPPESGGYKPGYYNFYFYDSVTGTYEAVVGTYATTYTIDKAIDAIQNQLTEPWLCVVRFHASHSPWGHPTLNTTFSGCMPPEAITHSAPGTYDANPANANRSAWDSYRAGIEAYDFEMGRMFTAMGTDLIARTDIHYVGDNGTPQPIWEAATALGVANLGSVLPQLIALNGFKGDVREAGVRVPYVVQSPIITGAPRSPRKPVSGVDIYETIRHLTTSNRNDSIPPDRSLDGVSVVPILQSNAAVASHPRTTRLSERWTPNGPPSASSDLSRGWAFKAADGATYKIIQTAGEADQMFQLFATNDNDVDPWELTPLAIGVGGAKRTQYLEGIAALEALLAS